jgi:hypothetical protein
MMFMVKATSKGLIVAKPYGESHRYDFLVDSGKRLGRVQVLVKHLHPLARLYRKRLLEDHAQTHAIPAVES